MFKRILVAAAISAAASVASAAPVSYVIDPNHTEVIASWNHFGLSNPFAFFGHVDGTLVYDAQNVSASSVKVTLPLSGLDTRVEAFDGHLRSADWFNAEKYPNITFASTKVESKGKNHLRVTGDLTIKGITKPAVLDVTLNGAGVHPMAKREAVGFDATTTIKRSDFGIDKYAPNVSDAVKLRITTEALVPKAEHADAEADAKPARAKVAVPPKTKK